ncbi:(d)CMP kinase [Kaistella palustris]|uniref:(d)CMP kinase n=1 Tax=Kaistella palustris TaxID=493376 RepID=UPI000417CECA|nr:(d)CMP kinase [Kaistella palustris]
MRKPVIAVDGFSSTGKSSISKIIAEKLGLVHMDTGALYRGVTYYALSCCMNDHGQINLKSLLSHFNEIHLDFRNINGCLELFLNGKNICTEIRAAEVSASVSLIAAQKEVRDFLLDTQRNMAQNGGVILDGRDIGTVVFPDADYKFFLTASIEERTNRRFKELESLGYTVSFDDVAENLQTRDRIDSEREVAPLKKAGDAIVIDNTFLTKEETIQLMLSYIKDI